MSSQKIIRTYSDLVKLGTFVERYQYLKLHGVVGGDTFGFDRYLNQVLYRSKEWRDLRHRIIVRDNGCDMALEGWDICGPVTVHHMNPLTVKDVDERNPDIFEPEFLVCVSHNTHNAIHYGDESLLPKEPIERRAGDTCPWKK